jgi:hypothetical protein
MLTNRMPVISAACLALTSLALATLGAAPATADTSLKGSDAAARLRGARTTAKSPKATQGPARPFSGLPAMGPSPVSGADAALDGLPVLTRQGVRSLRVGDPLTLPTPDGDVIRYEVDRRGFTDADTCEIVLRSAGRETTYGLIVQRGTHLAGFLQRVDGRAYRLMPAANGAHRLDRVIYPEGVDCGVGKTPIPGMATPEMLAARDGVAGEPGISPCPPEAAPFDLPQTLRKDNGMIIDVLFVFTQNAADLAAQQGRDVRTLAGLAVAQANLAMFRSTLQPMSDFDGQDGNNNLNNTCGYGAGGFPAAPAGATCEFGWPLGMSGTCKDDTSEPPKNKVTTHATLAGVTPAEQEVCTPRIRLVAALVADGFFGQESPYNSTGLAVDLGRAQNPFDGYMDYVPTWRDALGADSVCVVGLNYGSDSAFIGLASLMGDANNQAQGQYFPATSVVPMPLNGVGNPHPLVDLTQMPDPDLPFDGGNAGVPLDPTISTLQAFQGSPYSLLDYTAIDDLVYAHELGHNLGCQHNHDDGDPSADALFPDSFGYRTQGGGGAGQEGFKTVMSYGNQVRVPGYSNPFIGWNGFIPGNPEVPGDAAGIEFDFACTGLDGDGTDVQYIQGTGINQDTCEPANAQNQCDNETDEDPNSTDPAPMVVRADVEIDAQLDEDQSGAAYNSRSISQAKFDFAKFRCSVFPVVDCNDDTVDDFVQALDGFLTDCDANGVPDECETTPDPGSGNPNDCNGNGVPDACDINDGTSADDNVNLIPDECEDQTALFSETFERIPFGFVEGSLPIAQVSEEALKELRKLDPDFPDHFATIETVGLSQAPGNGGYVYFDVLPNAFQYRLGGNGVRPCPDFTSEQVSATNGFARAIGNRGYGQSLDFDSVTGDFPSQAGITTITAARDCKEVRLYLNAADFTGYFNYEPPLPLLNNYPYLEENVVFVSAYNEAGELVYEQSLDLRGQWASRTPGCSENPNPQGFVFLRIGAPLGSDTELQIRSVEIRGAFVVIDNISFDAGLDDSAYPCVADIAGGPLDPLGLPTPDGRVGGEDLLTVLAAYGYGLNGFPQFTTCPPDDATPGEELPRIADINEDCQVDSMDLLEVLAAWGQCLGGVP